MSLGPWFKCFPSEFLNGMRDMDSRKQGFYCQIIFRMYEAADAIYADDRTIGRWCNSNARPWVKIKEELIAEGRLVELSDGGLINPRALQEMAEQARKSNQVPAFIRERLAKLLDMFGETFGKDLRKIRETSPEKQTKTKPLKEARSQKTDIEFDKSNSCSNEIQTIVDRYNQYAEARQGWPKCLKPSPRRRKAIQSRLNDFGLEDWLTVLDKAAQSKFLSNPTFSFNIEWLAGAKQFEKILEGGHDDKTEQQAGNVASIERHRQRQPSTSDAWGRGFDQVSHAVGDQALSGRDGQELHRARAHADGSTERSDPFTIDSDSHVVTG